MSKINIRQKTNFDLIGGETKKVWIGGDNGQEESLTYKKIVFENENVFKFGYCTNDNEGMNYPIFIVFNDNKEDEHEFQIGKTGMFEYQLENWDEDESYPDERKYTIKEIKVYEHVPFVLDYCYSV